MNPYTHQEISADSIIERVMTFAPLYETIVSDYRANLYIKGKMDIQKKNFIPLCAFHVSFAKGCSRISA